MKHELRHKFYQTPIQAILAKAQHDFTEAQTQLHLNPHDEFLVDVETCMAMHLKKAKKDYASYIQQQAKLNWLQYGDENTSLFHNNINQRRKQSIINLLTLNGKKLSDPTHIQQTFMSFYSELLCSSLENRKRINMPTIQAGTTLTQDPWPLLDLSFNADEIKEAL